MDRKKLLKMVIILAFIVVIAGSLTRLAKQNSMTLTEYAKLHASSDGGEDTGEAVP